MEKLFMKLPNDIKYKIINEYVISKKLINDIQICLSCDKCKKLENDKLLPLISKVINNNDMLMHLSEIDSIFEYAIIEHNSNNKVFQSLDKLASFTSTLLFCKYH
jgi:hypothetical protein